MLTVLILMAPLDVTASWDLQEMESFVLVCSYCTSKPCSFSPVITSLVQNNILNLDIDECDTGFHNCDKLNADCNNNEGSFSCTCKEFYFGDGKNCEGKQCYQCQPPR